MALLGSSFPLPSLKRAKSPSPPFSKPWRHFFALLLGSLFLVGAAGQESARAQSDTSKEYQIKAAFLFNFAQFVKWPGNSFVSGDAPFKIGILGDDPFGSALDAMIQGETIDNHRLVVVRGQRIEVLEDCQMIFVSRS